MSARRTRLRTRPKPPTSTSNSHSRLLKLLTRLACLAFVIYALTSIISGQVTLSEKRQQLAALQVKSEQLTAENEEYQRLIQLSQEDERAYMEAIAVNRLGYAYPSEIRFYDPTRG